VSQATVFQRFPRRTVGRGSCSYLAGAFLVRYRRQTIRPSPDPSPSRHGLGRHSRHSVVQPAPAHPAAVNAHPVTRTLREGDIVSGFEVLEVPDTLGVRWRSGADGAVVRHRGKPVLGAPPGRAAAPLGARLRTHGPRAGSPPPLTRFCLRPHSDPHPRRPCGSGAPEESAGVGAEGCGLAPGL